ncbi:uncharacterized protein LOC123229378 isoform X2 [Mangifera indica]|uniref:uncharacterized protein LOC123229378 isoform X2 n=1 Tax=Mangifera indica TaxID=29780 RepID=UPI001CFC4072|nr:uncharacterized protein LOC123229378 isoform X2 [Mangifera indica]
MKTIFKIISSGRWPWTRWWWRWWRCGVMIIGALISTQLAYGGGGSSNAFISKDEDVPVSRIAFGSCADQSAPQPIWNAIIEFDPQVFIWLGDNIYGDIKRPFKLFGRERTIGPWKNVLRFAPTSQEELESRYSIIKNNPDYSHLRKTSKVIGTWDDHDYGLNDAGKEFPHKVRNQRLSLDFLDEPQDSPRRKQAGIYTSYMFGPVGKQIKIILLDTRYHRDPLNSDGSILGSAQWTWLEKELKGPPSAITIIGSSIQRDGVFFISGDVHFGEITRYDCAVEYPLYDVTSSGLTQAVEKVVPSPLHFIVRFLAWLTPNTMRVMDRNCRHRSCTYGLPNFGTIEIDWNATPVALKIAVRDMNGFPVTGVDILLSELQAKTVNSVASIKVGEQRKHCSLEVDLPWIVRYRLAIFFFFVLLLALVGLNILAASLIRLALRKCKLD